MENTVDLIIFMGQSNMAGRGIVDASHPQPAPRLTRGPGMNTVPYPTRRTCMFCANRLACRKTARAASMICG